MPGLNRFRELAQRPALLLTGTLLVSVALFIGVLVGSWGGLRLSALQYGEAELLRERVALLEQQLAAMEQLQAIGETRREVDAAALELVRGELAEQRQTIADLEQGLRFYRSLMAPGELRGGLSVRSFEVRPAGQPDQFEFRLVLQQQARKHEQFSGEVTVHLAGELEGEPASLELSTLSEQVPRPDIRFRFKYFQTIDGELALPSGFVPQRVHVTGKATRPRQVDIEQSFDWPPKMQFSQLGR